MNTLRCCCLGVLLFQLTVVFADHANDSSRVEPTVKHSSTALDQQVASALEHLANGEFETALGLAGDLSRTYPDFQLGHWLFAELSSIAALDISSTLSERSWSRQQVDLMLEARTRLKQHRQHRDPHQSGELIPRSLAHLGDDIQDAILVDLGHSELMHFAVDNGTPSLVTRHYVSSGSAGFGKRAEGDLKTPLGVYRIDGYRAGSSLPDLYGDGALTLDYPNALDRSLGRTGSGIWLHGVPQRTRSRAPWSSEGCVTMSNDHLMALIQSLDRDHSVVILTDRVHWITPTEANQLGNTWRAAVRQALTESTLIDHQGAGRLLPGGVGIDSLIEVPDLDGRHWLAWQPSSGATAERQWRFVPLPADLSASPPAHPKSAPIPALSQLSSAVQPPASPGVASGAPRPPI